MPYFNDPEYVKQYVGKTIHAIVSCGTGKVCFQFTDGTSMEMFAHQKAPVHVEGEMYRHPRPEIIVNKIDCGLNLPDADCVVHGSPTFATAAQAEGRLIRLPPTERTYQAAMARSKQLKNGGE
jgi:hypothetical protein